MSAGRCGRVCKAFVRRTSYIEQLTVAATSRSISPSKRVSSQSLHVAHAVSVCSIKRWRHSVNLTFALRAKTAVTETDLNVIHVLVFGLTTYSPVRRNILPPSSEQHNSCITCRRRSLVCKCIQHAAHVRDVSRIQCELSVTDRCST